MTPQQFFLILRARWLVLLVTFALVVGATATWSLLSPRQYTATASVVLDVKSPDPVSGMMLAGLMAPGYMATQVDIIKSDRVARRVVRSLRMDSSAAVQAQWAEDTGGRGNLVDWLSERIKLPLEVKPSRESNVINIEYVGNDPQFAAAVANAFAQAYVDVNVELRTEPARQYAGFFDEQTRAARERLEKAQAALSDYQQRHGITSVDERLDFETAKLNETSSQLTAIQASTTDSQSKRLRNDGASLAEVMQSPLINGLKADIARQEARLNEASINLGANHPQFQRMQTELNALREQLSAETTKITGSINTTYEVNRQREGQLRAALEAQKARVLEINQQRDQINVLRREIESAQRLFDTLSGRASQSTLESQTNQTNISVLNPATPPGKPSGPRTRLHVALAMFLGGLLGVMLAMALEFLQRRVRSVDDLALFGELPLLGQVSSARRMMRAPRLAKGGA
ncbi:MAG: chain length determinant protein EpsF [Hydrogenophaga sp.]|jgi:chain length determinant protein EpsF|uniref:Chain length determinant protein EpsF n=1 Tax=Hydrogenophaga crocea TaxID=2716225 RepID=A0A6G8ICE4_9BURK|nr:MULTISPECIES: chain length determinant protein EpsF [Hydrogenophaga]MBL0943587.1 chain length determinant protein EpsF [Hydrogenophaga sp.]QIM50706.1 chain length determinant protein EpsF [Hydrogenophaga crocea]